MPAPDACAKETTVELSEVTVLPAASTIVAVRTRVAPEVRLAVEPLRTMSAAAAWRTLKAPSVPVVSPAAVASIVTGPVRTPAIVFVATPDDAVALPVPDTVPAPEAFAKEMTVELSEVAVFPAASWRVAVRSRVAPEVRSAVEPLSAIWVAAPWTTVKAPSVPVVSPAAVASIVTVPVRTPVIVFVATPAEAVALPAPVTVPAPDAFAKATTVELSEVTVFPAASWIVAVSTRVAPDVRFAVEPVSAIWVAAPGTTLKAPSVPVVRPAAAASIVTVPASAPVIVLVATPAEAVALPVPLTVPAPADCANAITVVLSEVTVLPAASWIVAVRFLLAPDVRSAVEPVSDEVGGRAVDNREGAEGHGGEAGGGGFHRDRAGEHTGDRLRRDTGGGGGIPVPDTVPAPDAFAKATTVELSDVTVLPAASWRVAVSTRVAPEVRFAVEPLSAIWVAAPGTTSNELRVPVVSPAAVASIVTVPARTPVIVFVATPLEAVALPAPLTVPAPEAFAKEMTVVLSEVTVLPAASSIVAVRTRVAPEARSAVEPVRTMSAAAPCATANASVPVVRPADVASSVIGPASAPVIVLVATPPDTVALPVPVTVPTPDCFANAITVVLSEVTVLPPAS